MPESIVELKKLLEARTSELQAYKERFSFLTGEREGGDPRPMIGERFHSFFRNTSACVSLAFPDGRFIEVNPSFCRFLGYSADELMALTAADITHPDDRAMLSLPQTQAQQGSTAAYTMEKRFLRRDGMTIVGQVTGNWFYGAAGEPICAMEMIQDITDRKRIEEALRQSEGKLALRALELESANRELEAFNFSVSHDLRSPLTTIGGFCEVLLGLGKAHLDDECKSIIRHITGTVRYMDQLIETMLNFSRLSQCKMTLTTVDLSTTAKAVAALLRMRDPHREVTVTVSDDIHALGDAKLLREVLSNLLGNAWKFTAKQEKAMIEFGVTESDNKTVYFVRDNGPGFDMAQAAALFIPFHRLHTREEFSGHGIGLSTAQRIIHRHGGRIWAEGEAGKGATFFFTLDPSPELALQDGES